MIREQLNEEKVERVSGPSVRKEFYIPEKADVRESAESTKLRFVYDASGRASKKVASLNECWTTVTEQIVGGVVSSSIPTSGTDRGYEAGLFKDQNTGGRQRHLAISLGQ